MNARRVALSSMSLTLLAFVIAWRVWSAPSPFAFDGIVRDEKTLQPLEGVFIIVQWENSGGGLVDARTTCADLYVTQTDAHGRYHVPTYWPAISPFVDRYIRVYKIGYESAIPTRPMSVSDYEQFVRDWPMREFTGTGDERLGQYNFSGYLTMCGRNKVETYRRLLPLERAINQEAKTLKVNPDNERSLMGHIGYLQAFEKELAKIE